MNAILSAAAGLAISTACFAQPNTPPPATPTKGLTTVTKEKPSGPKMMGGVNGGGEVASPAKDPRFPDALPDLKDPTLFVVGYAHLDTQWRWTYEDTIREFIPNTLRDNFKLFEKYPHYVFNFSGSRRYKMMQEYYPDDFTKLKGYVAAGKWFPCGSSVDENDANVPSAESLVRHVLYGNKYFREQFGIASQEYMLPDCFGFPAALPSVLAHCGVKGFSTQKLTWNAVTPIPFKVGTWLGPDGHGVIAALDPEEYVGQVKENLANENKWIQRIQNNGKASGVYTDYHYFGTGDQGGAPRESSVAKVEESVNTKGAIKVISGPADAMFKAITPDMAAHLPTYKGELELTEHSAGSVTSEAYMKRWNRKNELLADAAEKASVMAWWMGGRPYPSQRIEDAWYLVLGSQMHDILPGTSVPRAYDLSWNDECIAANQFSGFLEDAAGSVISGMDTRSSAAKAATFVVYNPLSVEREDVVEVEVIGGGDGTKGVTVTGPDGKPVAAQVLGVQTGSTFYTPYDTTHGVTRVAFLAKAPAVGLASYSVELVAAPASAGSLKVSDHQLENDCYVVKLDAHGDVSSIHDKKVNKELLSAPARIALQYENPANWPAWNQDWADRQKPAKSFAGDSGPVTFKVVENGPARVAVEVTRSAEGSTFIQRIRLSSGTAASRIEFDTDIDWRTRERSARAAFPLSVSNPEATYDIQTGAISRGNGHAKQFEYAFHQWFDLSGSFSGTALPGGVGGDAKSGTDAKTPGGSPVPPAYGVTVMCDSKYGADKPSDNTVRLTLLHTPGTRGGYPDQGSQDLGRHHILYAIEGHSGTWQHEHTYLQAARLNQPLKAFLATPHEGPLGKSFSLMHTSTPAVTISAVKKAEDSDEVIIRLREQTGAAVKGVHIALAKPILSAREVDGQERELTKAKVEKGELVADMTGYELRAFAVKLGDAPTQLSKVESKPLALPYDTDVVSTNANRADGAFDSTGASIPAEQFPSTLTDAMTMFTFGKTADGEKNAVACKGQEIALPQGDYDTLYVLAAADYDVNATFDIGGTPIITSVQAWNGYVGQWDHRLWPGDSSDPRYPWNKDIVGLEPGFVKPDSLAWFCSHHHTKAGDAFYSYSYIFKYPFDLPKGAKSFKLPNDPKVKVFAATVAKVGQARATAAAPLFDTLSDHVQDLPKMEPAEGKFDDTIAVRLEPSLYWKQGAIHFTTDGANPTVDSTVYDRPIWILEPTTLKAVVVDANGHAGPVASARFEVVDKTGPSFLPEIGVGYQSNKIELTCKELLDTYSVYPSNFTIEPAIEVSSVSVAKDGYHVTVNLAKPPTIDTHYHMSIQGIKDYSPAKNVMEKPQAFDFTVKGPVYTLAEYKASPDGAKVTDIKNLPMKAKDAWTLNLFVKTDKQPDPRTVIAGFGKCEQTTGGNGRYICRFPGGLQFWAHNQDVPTRTTLDLDKWQMLTATFDGSTLRMYKNGERIAERGIGLADDESVINIAPKDPWDHERQFKGEIKGLSIWSSALNEEALSTLMKSMPQ